MMDASHLAAFLLPVIAISMIPGPDTLYVLNRSISQGRRAGLAAALGSANGVFGHITLSVVGFSALLMASRLGFLIVKVAGAAYLVYLGIRLLLKAAHVSGEHKLPHDPLSKVWLQGVLTNILNPKVAVFFLAFIPQFIDSHRGHISMQFLTLGVIFDAIGTSWLCFVALAAGHLSRWFATHPSAVTLQSRLTGLIFLMFAAKLALT
ncbi:MAG: LysE family translocator [Acidobacteriaceae bacterium]|nr:LysE family translocator [Acidobacteriaceae bacterium]